MFWSGGPCRSPRPPSTPPAPLRFCQVACSEPFEETEEALLALPAPAEEREYGSPGAAWQSITTTSCGRKKTDRALCSPYRSRGPAASIRPSAASGARLELYL